MTTPEPPKVQRRAFLATALVSGTVLSPAAARAAASCAVPFNRAAYERYVGLMNAEDPRFVEYYTDDIKFEMNLRGKSNVLEFYRHQWPYIKETLAISFFCSDASGAAAQVFSELRCSKDNNDTTIFGRALKAGEVQRVRGYVFYTLNAQGLITEIKGPPPEVLQPWHLETT
ncbi:MAG: nuclear transport factor 2 family protein [Sphingomonadaceae bacterium]